MLQPNTTTDSQTINTDRMRRSGGSLAETLDRTLEPRLAPGRPGRPKGARNYDWSPEMDRILEELCVKFGPAKAKTVMKKQLLDMRAGPGVIKPRPDSLRNAVERRMVRLGLPTGEERKIPQFRHGKPWASTEITALLGALGGDLIDESIEQRTHHTIKAVRAKLARLNYRAHELRGVAFTVDDLAEMLHATERQIRRWKEKGWLKTTRRRIGDKDLADFLKCHHERVSFHILDRETQVFLMSLGYPAKELAEFQATVKSILDDVAGRKKRCDARDDDAPTRAKPMRVDWRPLDFAGSAVGIANSA